MTEYIVWQPENGQTREDGRKLRANSAAEAAESWAYRDDAESNEFHIVNGTPATVMVWCGGLEAEFIVTGESVRQYQATMK